MTMRTLSRLPRALGLAAWLLGCNSSPDLPQRDPPPPPPRPAARTAETTTSSASAAPTPTLPTAAETASAAASASTAGGLAGVWEGRYEAKKGSVTLPPKVKDKGIAADDGKAAVGPGSIELTVLPSGEIRGKVTGALGAGSITGKVDGEVVRAMVRPDDPFAANAMTGVVVGERKGEAIACEMHVAGPDGTVIREAKVELKKK
jgi:hypothetical protein